MRKDIDLSVLEKARKVQEEVARSAALREPADTSAPATVGGTDAAYAGDLACACVSVMEYESLRPRVSAAATARVRFPYIPGYFGFREIPVLLEAFRLVTTFPDILLVHGHGYAHPRRAGMAIQLGLLLDIPTIGVTENLLSGMVAQAPMDGENETTPVFMDGEAVGSLVRPRKGGRPLCVSPGYRMTLPAAIRVVLHCTGDHRLPEPIFSADRCARLFLKETGKYKKRS